MIPRLATLDVAKTSKSFKSPFWFFFPIVCVYVSLCSIWVHLRMPVQKSKEDACQFLPYETGPLTKPGVRKTTIEPHSPATTVLGGHT